MNKRKRWGSVTRHRDGWRVRGPEITSVRVERLQEISEEDAVNEGIERITHIGPCRAMGWRDYTGGAGFMSPIESYRTLWNQLNNKSGRRWEDNLWVWALDLKRVTP
jgi:hypothetical protein